MIYSAQHRAVVYPANPAILNAVPGARELGNRVVVPANLRNMQLCRILGLQVPSLIETEYDWPIRPGWTPTPQQRQMAAFLTMHPRAFNLSDPRTGKTLAALWAFDFLMRQGEIKRALIIPPLSTLDDVWMDEIFTHFMGRRKAVMVYGSREKRLELLGKDVDFYIINHDGLGVGSKKTPRGLVLGDLACAIRDRPDINAVLADESTAYKEHTTTRTKILMQVTRQKPYVWLLTGTPTPNNPTDAWSQKKIITPHMAESFFNYRDKTMYRVSNFKWVPKNNAKETVYRTLQPSIRFSRAECGINPTLHCPPPRDVQLSAAQQKAYDLLKKNTILLLANGSQIDAVNEAVLRMKLIQVVCGAIYDRFHTPHLLDCTPRLDALRDELDKRKSKFIVFAPLTSVVDLIYTDLSRNYRVAKITGSVVRGVRQDVFNQFKRGDLQGMVADPGTMAHGLDFSVADTIVWFGPTDRPEHYEQANARINGPGQRHEMRIIRLAATATEREIYTRLANKQSLAGAIHRMLEGAK
jgi:hypothetical protein